MAIGIQNSSAILTALENRSTQPGGSAEAGPATAPPGSSPANQADPASVLDLSAGAAAALNGLTGGLAHAASLADVAVTAGNTVESLLAQMRQDALSAAEASLGQDQRASLDAGFRADLAKIGQAVSQAQVGGVNLIDGSVTGPLSQDAQGATLTGTNLSLAGPLIGLAGGASLADPEAAATVAEQLGSAIDNVSAAVGRIAAQGQAIATHLSLVAQAGLALGASGAAGTLDADGARLQALQIQQQLMGSPAALANQSPSSILALFR